MIQILHSTGRPCRRVQSFSLLIVSPTFSPCVKNTYRRVIVWREMNVGWCRQPHQEVFCGLVGVCFACGPLTMLHLAMLHLENTYTLHAVLVYIPAVVSSTRSRLCSRNRQQHVRVVLYKETVHPATIRIVHVMYMKAEPLLYVARCYFPSVFPHADAAVYSTVPRRGTQQHPRLSAKTPNDYY